MTKLLTILTVFLIPHKNFFQNGWLMYVLSAYINRTHKYNIIFTFISSLDIFGSALKV